MAIPHIIFKQSAKKRLVGKEGKEKDREIRKLLAEMPDYRTGPYGEVRKWLMGEMRENRARRHVRARSFFDVKKEGDAQIAIVGPPNIGKSSLLRRLSSIRIKVADYAFTTLKPIPAAVDFGGALVQLVEIPGLVEGASAGKGGGKAMTAAARNANYIVLMTSADTPVGRTLAISREIGLAGLPPPKFMICGKMDLPQAEKALAGMREAFPDMEIVPLSTETNAGLEELKVRLWENLHLIRVFAKEGPRGADGRPVVVPEGATVSDVAERLRKSAEGRSCSAKVWGPSARFPGQEVGGKHALTDGDSVWVLR